MKFMHLMREEEFFLKFHHRVLCNASKALTIFKEIISKISEFELKA